MHPGDAGGLGLACVSRFGQAGVDPDHLLILEAQHQHPRIRFPRLRGIQHLNHTGMRREDPDRFFSTHEADHTCGRHAAE